MLSVCFFGEIKRRIKIMCTLQEVKSSDYERNFNSFWLAPTHTFSECCFLRLWRTVLGEFFLKSKNIVKKAAVEEMKNQYFHKL